MNIFIACLFLFLSVLLGAFGAHGLEHILDEKALSWWHTATQYMSLHAMGLLFFGIFTEMKSLKISKITSYSFIGGIFLFSGSLYALAITNLRILGMITPIGGLLFMIAWLNFAYLAWKNRSTQTQ